MLHCAQDHTNGPSLSAANQAAVLDPDAVARWELAQVGDLELHGASDVEDRLVGCLRLYPCTCRHV